MRNKSSKSVMNGLHWWQRCFIGVGVGGCTVSAHQDVAMSGGLCLVPRTHKHANTAQWGDVTLSFAQLLLDSHIQSSIITLTLLHSELLFMVQAQGLLKLGSPQPWPIFQSLKILVTSPVTVVLPCSCVHKWDIFAIYAAGSGSEPLVTDNDLMFKNKYFHIIPIL